MPPLDNSSVTKPPIGQAPGKQVKVEAMFDEIAPRYDLLNRVLSFGIDAWWRRQAVTFLRRGLPRPPRRLLDVATGTADLAIESLRLTPEEVTGIDISTEMLRLGREKLTLRGLHDRIRLIQGDAANLPLDERSCDGATVAFGVRNFENLQAGLCGIRRALRPGAPLVVLEFSHPTTFPVKQGYALYSHLLLPIIGRAISGSSDAYEYLPESVAAFPDGDAFLAEMRKAGFSNPIAKPLSFGIVTLYRGEA